MLESDLYPPLKRYLESQRYAIKGEVADCDVCALRDDEPPLVVELKLSLNLTVVLQAVDRLALTPSVYVGVPADCSALQRRYKQVRKLFRLLGIGLLAIDTRRKSGAVRVLLDPGAYRPRIDNRRQSRLLGEFEKRVGDPNQGGSSSRRGVMTAYRQRALRIARYLQQQGPTKASEVARHTAENDARAILYRDVYGWFDKVSRGIYTLSPRGEREIEAWPRPDSP